MLLVLEMKKRGTLGEFMADPVFDPDNLINVIDNAKDALLADVRCRFLRVITSMVHSLCPGSGRLVMRSW